MRYPKNHFVLIALALLALAALPVSALADKPPSIPAYYNDRVVVFTVVSDNVVGVDNPGIERHAIPLYAFGDPGTAPQFDVLSAIPGVKGYNPWWEVVAVIPINGRDVSTDPFTSEAEILAAAAAGEVILIDTDFFFLCQVLPGRAKLFQ